MDQTQMLGTTTADRPAQTRRARFARWAQQRPFLGGAAMIAGGAVVVVFPFTPVPNYVTAGVAVGGFDRGSGLTMVQPPLGSVGGLALVVLGTLTLARPDHRRIFGIAGDVAGIVSFLLNHLGGFVVGMLLGIVGGALAFSWQPGPRPGTDRDDDGRDERAHADHEPHDPITASTAASTEAEPMLPFSSTTSSSRH